MANKAHLQAILSAVDRISPVLSKLNSTASRTRAGLSSLNNINFDRMRGALNAMRKTTADAGFAARRASANLLPLVGLGGITAGGAGAGFIAAARGAMSYASSVQDAADTTGIGVEALQKIQGAMRIGGLETEAANEAIVKFNKSIADGAAGKDKSFAALMTRLRIPLRNVRGEIRSAVDILPEFADAIQKNQNPAVRTRMLMEAFGKTGAKLAATLGQGGTSLYQLYSTLQQSGRVMSPGAIDALDKLDETMEGLGQQTGVLSGEILARGAPAIMTLSQKLGDLMAKNKELIAQRLGAVIDRIARSLTSWVESGGFERLSDQITRTWQVMSDFVRRVGGIGNVLKGLGVLILAGPVASLVSLASSLGRLALTVLPMVGRAVLLLGRVFLLNPIGLVLTAIAGAAYLIYRNWSTVGPFFQAMWERIKTAGEVAWNVLKALFGWSPLGMVINNWGAITAWLGKFWDELSPVVRAGIDLIAGLLNDWAPIKLIKAAWAPVLGYLSELWDKVKVIVGKLSGGASDAMSAAGKAVTDNFTGSQQYGPRLSPPTPLISAGAFGGGGRMDGRIQVDFQNLPQGARVTPAPNNARGISTSVDYGVKGTGSIG